MNSNFITCLQLYTSTLLVRTNGISIWNRNGTMILWGGMEWNQNNNHYHFFYVVTLNIEEMNFDKRLILPIVPLPI